MNNRSSVGSHTHSAIFNISPNKGRERNGSQTAERRVEKCRGDTEKGVEGLMMNKSEDEIKVER